MIINHYNMQPPTPTPLPTPPSGFGDAKVIFIDYDGTVLASYTASEFSALPSLPDNPSHTDIGLAAQGWNWTRAEIQTQLTSTPDQTITVGQLYTTVSGDTEIDIILNDDCNLAPSLSIAVNGSVEIDWGDNSQKNTVSFNSLRTTQHVPHIYNACGSYTIKIKNINGQYAFITNQYYYLLSDSTFGDGNMTANESYSAAIVGIRIGNGCYILGDNAFSSLYNCKYITIPDGVRNKDDTIYITNPFNIFLSCASLKGITIPRAMENLFSSAFSQCDSLQYIALPYNMTAIKSNAFYSCSQLKHIFISDNITEIGDAAFHNCQALTTIHIPDNITVIGGSAFYGCYMLNSIEIPEGTSLGEHVFFYCRTIQNVILPNDLLNIPGYFLNYCKCLRNINIPSNIQSIHTNAFYGCGAIQSITIPDSVIKIYSHAFESCGGIKEYHFKPTTPPILEDVSAFYYGNPHCIFYVPQGCLEAYKTAANWSTYASRMQEEPA